MLLSIGPDAACSSVGRALMLPSSLCSQHKYRRASQQTSFQSWSLLARAPSHARTRNLMQGASFLGCGALRYFAPIGKWLPILVRRVLDLSMRKNWVTSWFESKSGH